MATDKDLARIMFEIKATIPLAVNDVAKADAKVAGRLVVGETPVDTGAARSNWIGSPGSPSAAVITPYAPGKHLGRGESANKQGAVNQIEAATRSLRPGQDFYITNNLDYIEDLNNSPQKSRQTAPGFVQRSVVATVETVDVAAILKKRLGRIIGRS